MEIPERVRPFWERFQASIAYDARPLFYEAFHFDDNEPTANALGALVLSGEKRATAGLLWTNECTSKPLPAPGALSVVTDWAGAPLCVIRTTRVDIVPFEAVTESFAAREGEGDRTLRWWRDAHWRFFSRECRRLGREPAPDMPVVCEQFDVVYPTPDAVSDAVRVRDAILGALPGIKRGPLRIWGDWFGRPHDNLHRVVGASADGERLTVDFDAGELLMVWRPAGYAIDGAHFRIDGADRVRWEWVPYGRAERASSRAFLDYVRQGPVIRGESNVTWFTPAFQTDSAMPAAELV